ncbi:hypothetical protein EC988_005144 [Linderina pennispora]|nr:hypothetical protein EC988_005144 [Linderina pennispora]
MNEPPNTACRAEYHAVFSRTWQVPVLYLRVFDGDEHVMDVEKAKRLLVRDAGLRASMDAVGFGGALGIQDHPLLNVPFLYLHPCHTATLLRSVAAAEHGIVVGTSAYMAAWLSLTGQAAGVVLHTPPAE